MKNQLKFFFSFFVLLPASLPPPQGCAREKALVKEKKKFFLHIRQKKNYDLHIGTLFLFFPTLNSLIVNVFPLPLSLSVFARSLRLWKEKNLSKTKIFHESFTDFFLQ